MTEDESSQRLQRLLRLKRNETPPPGYFGDFSSGVVDRIRALETERRVPFWQRWFSIGSRSDEATGSDASFVPGGAMLGWGVAFLVTACGAVFWGAGFLDPESSEGSASRQVVNVGFPAEATQTGTFGGVSAVGVRGTAWAASRPAPFRSATPWGDERFAVPVSVSMAGSSTELSSTNPFPPGLFRLPGASSSGPEAYRVRFGEGPK